MSAVFPIKTILSIHHQKIICSFDEYREFLDYMAGQHLYLHDLTPASVACSQVLEKQIPALKKTPPPTEDAASYRAYLNECAEILDASELPVKRLKKGIFTPRTPGQAMAELYPSGRV